MNSKFVYESHTGSVDHLGRYDNFVIVLWLYKVFYGQPTHTGSSV